MQGRPIVRRHGERARPGQGPTVDPGRARRRRRCRRRHLRRRRHLHHAIDGRTQQQGQLDIRRGRGDGQRPVVDRLQPGQRGRPSRHQVGVARDLLQTSSGQRGAPPRRHPAQGRDHVRGGDRAAIAEHRPVAQRERPPRARVVCHPRLGQRRHHRPRLGIDRGQAIGHQVGRHHLGLVGGHHRGGVIRRQAGHRQPQRPARMVDFGRITRPALATNAASQQGEHKHGRGRNRPTTATTRSGRA